MNQLSRKIAIFVLMAGALVATAVAGPKPDPAPRQEARPIPEEIPDVRSGRLDIDFRFGDWTGGVEGIVTVTASGGILTRNRDCPANVSDANGPDGFGVDDGSDCDDGIEKRESLVIDIHTPPGGTGTAAFDVNGVWLTDFIQKKNGEAGLIEIFGVGPEDRRTFSFSWKDVDPGPVSGAGNPNAEYFVGFGETQRITKAVLTATSGAFSVAGFSQQPVVMVKDECEQDKGKNGCFAEIAQNVFLDIKPRTGGVEGAPGNRGVSGELIKDGVYIVEDIRGPACGNGGGTLRIDLDDDDTTYEVVMQSHQCGYPDLDHPDKNVIYVLDLNGSKLDIAEDTIPVRFGDDAGDPDGYFCNALDPSRRPAYGWVPHGRQNGGVYEEIPLLGADGMPLLGDENLPNPVQDVTTGSCGSGRGRFSRFSLVPYHWVNASGTVYEITIGERIDRLQGYVDQLFPCVQQGVNQSTLSDDTGHIRKSFDMGRYQRAVDYIAEMRENLLAPRLNDEISQCFFDLRVVGGGYVKVENASSIPANAVGNLLVQLDHLRWMIRSTLLGEMPGDIPELD